MNAVVKDLRERNSDLKEDIEEARDNDNTNKLIKKLQKRAKVLERLIDKATLHEELEDAWQDKIDQHRREANTLKKEQNQKQKATQTSAGGDGVTPTDSDSGVAPDGSVSDGVIDRWVDESPAITFDDVGGMEHLKNTAREDIIKPFAHPELFDQYGLDGVTGVYLHGESGTGKSYFAKALAGQLSNRFDEMDDWDFISVSPADVMSEMVGEPASKLKEVFTVAREVEPCVVFFDECDGIFPDRDQRGITGNERQLVNEALTQLIEINESDSTVLVIGATNNIDMIDTAMRSSHRFQRKVEVPMPDGDSREAVLKKQLREPPTQLDNVDYKWFREESGGLSAADVSEVAESAARIAANEALEHGERPPVTRRHLREAMQSLNH